MGCDIHIFFEKQNDEGKWYCYPFKPSLDPDEWYEHLFWNHRTKKTETDKAMVAFGCNDPEEARNKLIEYYKNMPIEEAEEQFKNNPHVYRIWDMPYELRSRNYQLFSRLSGVRGDWPDTLQPEPLGVPEDSCFEIKRQYEYEKDDSHTESWVMLDELFQHNKLARERNVQSIKTHFENIPDIEFDKIRMVFWYDN